MQLVHPLGRASLVPDVVGLRGARLSGMASLGLPVAPGFVIGTAAWHLARIFGAGWGMPATLAEELGVAVAVLGRAAGPLRLTVTPAPAGSEGGEPVLDVGVAQLELVVRRLLVEAPSPTALVVQTRPAADGRPPSGRGLAFTRDPASGTVWPTGEFTAAGSRMDLEAFGRWLPAVGIELRAALARVESLHRTVCEVEFTLEAGRLWIVDARPVPHSRDSCCRLVEAGLVECAPALRRPPAGAPGS